MQLAKRRAWLFALCAMVCICLAGGLFLQKVQALDSEIGSQATIYVAKRDLHPKQPLNLNDFERKEFPAKFIFPNMIQDWKKDLASSEPTPWILIMPIQKGEPLLTNMVKKKTELASSNHRLVFLGVSNRVTFDQEVSVYDRVDLVLSKKVSGIPETTLFLRGIPVVTVARKQDNSFGGIGVELPIEQATQLIHEQNFAISIRVLKAPQ